MDEMGTSASEAAAWFYLDNAGTRTDSSTPQARALYLACSAGRRATPFKYSIKLSLSSPPPSALLLQMAEQGELHSRAAIPIIPSSSSLLLPVFREMPVTGGHPSWAQFHDIFNLILLVLLIRLH